MLIAALLFGIRLSASTASPFDVRRAANDRQALAVMQDIALRGAHEVDQQEVAAFIVRDANGAISSVLWPHTANRSSEHYDGVIPAGTVAIAHTHPIFLEHPSSGDIAQARRIGLPIYVITRWNLYVVNATGAVMRLIENRNWTHSPGPSEVPAE